jgi:predicted CopG family antitoxin
MPEEGYRTITIREEVYVKLSKLAEKTNRSIPKTIEHLLKNAKGA